MLRDTTQTSPNCAADVSFLNDDEAVAAGLWVALSGSLHGFLWHRMGQLQASRSFGRGDILLSNKKTREPRGVCHGHLKCSMSGIAVAWVRAYPGMYPSQCKNQLSKSSTSSSYITMNPRCQQLRFIEWFLRGVSSSWPADQPISALGNSTGIPMLPSFSLGIAQINASLAHVPRRGLGSIRPGFTAQLSP